MVSCNLVLFHVQGLQDISDFLAISMRISARYPEIGTSIYTIRLSPEDLYEVENCDDGVREVLVSIDAEKPYWKSIGELPTMLFSPVPLDLRSGLRGLRMFGNHLSKADEMRLLSEAGFPVPRTRVLDRGTLLDEAEWGPLVIVKSAEGRGGRQVRLMRTQDAARLAAETNTTSAAHMVAQQWIDTGPQISSFRAMTVLDRVVYILKTKAAAPKLIDAALVGRDGVNGASNGVKRTWEVIHDGDVLQLALDVCRTLKFTPTFGIDILRDAHTGALSIIELNSGYPTWHLSSRFARNFEKVSSTFRRNDLYYQYGALDGISDALAEMALTSAV